MSIDRILQSQAITTPFWVEISMSDSPLPQEIREAFRSLSEWRTWTQSHSFLRDGQYIQEVLKCITQVGVIDPLTGHAYPPNEVRIVGENFRETIRSGQLISRHRALLVELRQAGSMNAVLLGRKAKIYAPEALTEFALYMRGRYPRFLGSEYAETEEKNIPVSDTTPGYTSVIVSGRDI